ncbi:hypothetical protein ACVW0J_009349 [Bradyrhizobium sp. i1.7.7]
MTHPLRKGILGQRFLGSNHIRSAGTRTPTKGAKICWSRSYLRQGAGCSWCALVTASGVLRDFIIQSLSSVLSSPPHPHRGWLLPCERYSSSCNMNLSGRGVWLTDVGVGSNEPCHTLLVIAIALSIGALLLGLVADSRRPHGKNIETLLAIIASVFIAAELALVVNPPFLSLPSWIIVAVWPDQQSRSATRSSEITFRSE